MNQLALPLPVAPGYGREDFLTSTSNQQAWTTFEAWPQWPGPVVLLTGPTGAGKSHLAAIWGTRSGAAIIPASELTGSRVPQLASASAVLEDVDQGVDETSLFHLLNLMRQHEQSLVLTARSRPDSWGLRVPDLLSRLRLATAVEIAAPDDALVRSVLVKLFHDRQLTVDTNVVDYLALRMERSLGAARHMVETIDRASLEERRAVTRPMVAAVLARTEALAEGEVE